jgi:hypothetical protein
MSINSNEQISSRELLQNGCTGIRNHTTWFGIQGEGHFDFLDEEADENVGSVTDGRT